MSTAPTIGIIFYSTYGHIAALAESVIQGVKSTGVNVKVYQIQESLSTEVLAKMHAPPFTPKYPIVTPDDLKELDGIIWGYPTRYGGAPAQVRAFFDHTGGLWATGGLVGKFTTVFTSTASLHGGTEETVLSTMPFFAHQGMVYVPIGYVLPQLTQMESLQGGSSWGASSIAGGQGQRMPSEHEQGIAKYQGEYFSKFVSTFVKGRNFIAQQTATGTTATTTSAKELPTLGNAATGATAGGVGAAALSQEKGYAVDTRKETDTGTKTETTPQTLDAQPTTTNTTTTPAAGATAAAPTTAATTTTATTPKPKQKSGGFFASCCGRSNAIE